MKLLSISFLLLSTLYSFGQSGRVIREQANLRGTPSENGPLIDAIPRDTPIDVIKQNAAWFLVQTPELVGWLHGNTIELNSKGKNDVTPTTKIPHARSVRRRLTSDGYVYRLGPRGGCFYVNSSGNKTYVDHSYCR